MYDSDVGAREVNSRQEYFSVPKPCFFGERFFIARRFSKNSTHSVPRSPLFSIKRRAKLLGTSWVEYTHLQKKKLISNLTRKKKISLKTNSINIVNGESFTKFIVIFSHSPSHEGAK